MIREVVTVMVAHQGSSFSQRLVKISRCVSHRCTLGFLAVISLHLGAVGNGTVTVVRTAEEVVDIMVMAVVAAVAVAAVGADGHKYRRNHRLQLSSVACRIIPSKETLMEYLKI